MPDWTAPFKLPHMRTEDFLKMKAEYIAKNGYSYSFPGIAETLKYPFIAPMTPQEETDWRTKRFKNFSDMRLEELRFIKKKRKEKFLEMLGSPTPNILNSRSSIITSLDNTQDAISTAVVVAKLSARVLPKIALKALSHPMGWVMATADLINLSRRVISPELIPIETKRGIDTMTTKNPYSRKARIKNQDRFLKGKIGKGAIIEALQVTGDIFGVGITLGPIFSFPYDVIFGHIRMANGEKVTPKAPIPDWDYWKIMGKKALKAVTTKWTYTVRTDDQDMFQDMLLVNAAAQIESSSIEDFDTMESIDDVGTTLVRALAPTNVITREVLEEEGFNPDEGIAWPSTGNEWSSINEILESGLDIAKDNFRHFTERNKNSMMGFHGSQNAGDASLLTMENLAGVGSIEYDYTAPTKTIHALLNQGYETPADATPEQLSRLAQYLDDYESIGETPTTPEVLEFAASTLGFTFIRTIQ